MLHIDRHNLVEFTNSLTVSSGFLSHIENKFMVNIKVYGYTQQHINGNPGYDVQNLILLNNIVKCRCNMSSILKTYTLDNVTLYALPKYTGWIFYSDILRVYILLTEIKLTHCGPLTPYNVIDMGQHWLRYPSCVLQLTGETDNAQSANICCPSSNSDRISNEKYPPRKSIPPICRTTYL